MASDKRFSSFRVYRHVSAKVRNIIFVAGILNARGAGKSFGLRADYPTIGNSQATLRDEWMSVGGLPKPPWATIMLNYAAVALAWARAMPKLEDVLPTQWAIISLKRLSALPEWVYF